jgi:gliding motility-associated-like protein
MRALLLFSLLTMTACVYAQVPVIETIVPYNTFPNDTVVISGRGFDVSPANLEVWFESVKGTIIQSTDFSIVVAVPPQARFATVEVLNKTSMLSGKSRDKFMPSFPLGSFSAANFVSGYSVASTEEFWDICTCDLNMDGKPDMATSKFKRTFGNPSDISVFQNTGVPGTLAFNQFNKNNLSALNIGNTTDNIVCGDLQGDGKPDLVMTRSGGNRNTIQILKNTTTGATVSFATKQEIFMDPTHFSSRLVIRDLNNDGKPEIIATNNFNEFLYIFINQSSGGNIVFGSTPLKISVKTDAAEATTYDAEVQDFDGDGLADIVANSLQAADFFILKNQSSGAISFAAPVRVPQPGTLNRTTSADFNKDGKIDLVFTSTGSPSVAGDRVIVRLNQSTTGNINFGAAMELATSFEPWGIDAADIDGDKDPDFVVTNRNRATPVAAELRINIFLNDGAATPTFTRSDITTTTPTRNVKLTDMDGDSKADIVFTSFDPSANTARVNVLRNTNCFKPPILNDAGLKICSGQVIRLQSIAVSGMTYTWKDGGTTVGLNQPYYDITAPGTYTVTATSGTCSETSASFVVTDDPASAPPTPVISGGDLPACVGRSLDLSTAAVADEYFWTGPNNFSSNLKDPPSFAVVTETAGFYELQVRVGQCKSYVASKLIEVANLEDFEISTDATSTILCNGQSIDLYVNDLDGFQFDWKKDGTSSGLSGATFAASQEGSYTVVITPSAGVDCPITETGAFDITVYTPPVAAFTSASQACLGDDVAFTNQSTVDQDATTVYTWTFDDTQTSTDQNPTHTYAAAAAYDVTLDVSYTGVDGCTSTIMHPVTIVTPVQPVIVASAESSCPDEEVTLTIADFPSITWSTTETTTSISVTPGAYTVSTVDANGCDGTDDITIVALEVPVLSAFADPTEINPGGTSQLTASGADSYVWTPGSTLTDSLISNPVANPLTTTTYTLTGTSLDGCSAELQLQLVVDGAPGFPVAFSPNGDGQNEMWDIQATFNTECMITIFDGRGRRVFEAKGENWDGTYQGKAAPDGTYYYVYSCPDEKPITGSVLLFR